MRRIFSGLVVLGLIAFYGLILVSSGTKTFAAEATSPVAPATTSDLNNSSQTSTVQTSPDIINGLCEGVNLKVGTNCQSGGISDSQAKDKINQIIKTVINMFSLVVGVVSVIMIIIGGLKYITSGGDSTNVTGAKNTILYAVIGLVIVSLAQFIVRFVLSKVAAQ